MKLNEMLNVIPEKKVSGADIDFEVKGVVYDPLRVEEDFIYIAINIYTQLDKIEIIPPEDRPKHLLHGFRSVRHCDRDFLPGPAFGLLDEPCREVIILSDDENGKVGIGLVQQGAERLAKPESVPWPAYQDDGHRG